MISSLHTPLKRYTALVEVVSVMKQYIIHSNVITFNEKIPVWLGGIMMNVLSITIAKSFIDAYISVIIQLPSFFYLILHVVRLYHIALKMVTGWLPKRMHQ